jgi:hypothetical protein
MMNRAVRIAGVGLVLGMLVAVSAAQATMEMQRFVSRLDPVWARLAKGNAKFLTSQQAELLDDMAFASAVADGCPGFKVDKSAFDQGFASLRTNDYMKMSPDDKRTFEYRVMMAFGAASALYTAEGYLHPSQGCKFAETRRAGGPGRFWVQPAAATTAPKTR